MAGNADRASGGGGGGEGEVECVCVCGCAGGRGCPAASSVARGSRTVAPHNGFAALGFTLLDCTAQPPTAQRAICAAGKALRRAFTLGRDDDVEGLRR